MIRLEAQMSTARFCRLLGLSERTYRRWPELIHIRTRHKSPGQNGFREPAFQSLKYEHLYRIEIDDGHDLGLETETHRQLFNTIRPHQSLGGRRPIRARNPATFVKHYKVPPPQ